MTENLNVFDLGSQSSPSTPPISSSNTLFSSDSIAPYSPTGSAVGLGLSATQIVFIDSQVANYESLAQSFEEATVFVIDGQRDGITQITSVLSQYSNVQSVQVLSHGNAGEAILGNTSLNSANLERYSSQLQSWQQYLSEDADILFYGCNLAEGEVGMALVDQLSRLTGADIAASNDATGAETLGGDWDLEVHIGAIAPPLVNGQRLAEYDGLLDLGTNLIVNGSFENNTAAAGQQPVFRTLQGWTTTFGPGIQVFRQVTRFGNAADGISWVDLDSSGNSGMRQQIATQAGRQYQLSFAYTGRSEVGPNSSGVEAWWNGQRVAQILPPSSATNNWQTYTFTVNGIGGVSNLEFRAIGTSDQLGGFLDNVQLRQLTPVLPTASLAASPITTAGANSYEFNVTYSDNTAINTTTLDGNDVRVTGPNGFNQLATLVQVNNTANGTPRTATYRITAPGGTWDRADNGTYTVALQGNQVRDTLGNAAAAAALGNVQVNIPLADTLAPTASLNATPLTSAGGATYDFRVTYTDAGGVNVSSIDSSDVRVTGPNGFNQVATLVSVDNSSNGTPRTAIYRITAPGGTWDQTDNGAYTVALLANQVRDTTGNAAAATTLGSVQVNLPVLPPNDGGVFLSDLTPTAATNGWGPYERDRSNGETGATDGRIQTLNGVTYTKGLGVHASSDLTYALNGQYTNFRAELGVDDEVGSNGSVIFRVLADGTEIYNSGIMRGDTTTQAVDLNVAGRQNLRLIVTDAGDGIGFDHANWANARLIRAPQDTTAPTASLSATTLTAAGGNTYDFTVTYSDNTAVNVSSIDGSDIQVTGPNGFSQTASLVSINNTTNGTPRTATYRITAPGGSWDSADNGAYSFGLLTNQVQDTAGNAAAAITLGSAQVNIAPPADTTAPTATLSATNVTTGGGSSYDFTVTYADNTAVNISSVDSSDIQVTGPNGFSQTASLVSVNNTTNGTPRTATYRITAPGGTWDSADNGTYNIALLTNQVQDTAGNAVAANTLGSIQVTIPVQPPVDTTAPTASIVPGSIAKISADTYQFRVTYSDNTAISANSINNTDVRILGTNGYSRTATLVSVDTPGDGTPRTATYQVAVPNPVGPIDYTLSLQANEISDTAGNVAIAGLLANFQDSPSQPPGSGDGLRGDYYDNTDFTNFKLTRVDGTVNYDWGVNSPDPSIEADTFSVRWSGQVLPRYSETYTFYVTADDGVRLKVNGQTIVDQFVDQPRTEWSGTITLLAGQKYDIEMEYYESRVFAVAKLEWSSATQVREVIPTSQLFSAASTGPDTTPPTATLNAPVLQQGGVNTYDFDVTYNDNTAIDVSSLDSSDIQVTGPNGFSQTATLVRVNNTTNGKPRIATYRLTGPGGGWDTSDNGTYAITLQPNQVRDTTGNLMAGLNLGNLTVNITDNNPPNPWRVTQPGYVVERVATGFQLPVNIAFVPNPGPNGSDPLYYVTELYGNIKVVSRDGSVSDYATNLLNFNPTGEFPGSGELGVAGIVVDPTTGDVYASMLYDKPETPDGFTFPKVVKFTSTDGGKTAATATDIIRMPNDTQGQAHQISNLSFGPDGKLYVNMGDGFDVSTAQNLNSFRGKILRMNKDGSAPGDNPFYDAADGINAKDYVYAYGFRNPFGGDWRAADGKYYQVENGPEANDRLSSVLPGVNYGWDGTAQSMTVNALYNWQFPVAPLDLDFIEAQTFNGSGFPTSKFGNGFVSAVGFTYATGRVPFGKEIFEVSFNPDGSLNGTPTPFLEYEGTGKATVSAIAAGPDGLYFADLYQDLNAPSPIAPGANVWRIRYVG